MGARESVARRRPEPRAVRRRDHGPDRAARGRRRARGAGVDPGHQRPDRSRASLPGARRPVHAPRAVRRPRTASSSRSSATATTSTTRWRCSARRSGIEVRLAHPAGYGPNRAIVDAGDGARRGDRRPARLRRRIRAEIVRGAASSTPTPGRRWARRPRPRRAATRSPRYQVDEALLERPDRTRS